MGSSSRRNFTGVGLLGPILAAAAAGLCMYALRFTASIRSLPERLLEWLLILIPPQVFEALLLRFGFDAKRYALWAVSIGLAGLLAVLGWIALTQRWSGRAIVGLGAGLWLLTMLVVMPLTGAGPFAQHLIDGAWAAVVGYLAAALAYTSVLLIALLVDHNRARHTPATEVATDRRAALVGLGTTVTALLGAYALSRLSVWRPGQPGAVLDPQEPVPSGGLEPPTSHPEAVASSPDPAATSRPTPAPASTSVGFAEPRPLRPMKRDTDGALLPAGRRKGELTELITSNDDFYVVTKNAGGDPFLHAADWRLLIDGEVGQRIELDYVTLRSLPAVDTIHTLECISNLVAQCELAPFGCDLISNGRWKGVRVSDLLRLAGGVTAQATHLATIAADEYTAVLPIDVALDPDTLLAFEMNGEVLPREHGYPARLLVPGRYGLKNPKWLIGLRPTTREVLDWYGQRNWTKDAIVKTMTRIDVPLPSARLAPGAYNVAGIAYAGNRGIQTVEYSADGGETWRRADLLEPAPGRDTWVRWIGQFTREAGRSVSLVARATDGTGALQVEQFSLAQPDGASGWHRLEITDRES